MLPRAHLQHQVAIHMRAKAQAQCVHRVDLDTLQVPSRDLAQRAAPLLVVLGFSHPVVICDQGVPPGCLVQEPPVWCGILEVATRRA